MLGAGAVGSAALWRGFDTIGVGSAQEDGTGFERCDPCIDPYSGYLLPSAGPMEMEPDSTMDDDAGNETEPDVGNETNATGANATGNETEPATGANETGDGAPGNETDDQQPETGDDEGEGGTPGAPGEGGFPDFYFDPVGIRLRPGDVVAFDIQNELHTVTAYHPRFYGFQQRVPDGTPGFTSPLIVDGDTWYYRFEETGVYDIQCVPHESLGMVMRAVVLEEGDEVPEGYGTLPTEERGETEPGTNETEPDANESQPDANESEPGVNDTEQGANETEPGTNETEPDTDEQDAEAGPEPGTGGIPPSELALTVLSASELAPENIVDEETVAWTDLTGVESEPPF